MGEWEKKRNKGRNRGKKERMKEPRNEDIYYSLKKF